MVDITNVGQNIFMIDDQLYSLPGWGSVYLLNEEKKALVDTGPSTSAKIVLEGIKQLGVRPEDIDYLVVTHIHLDHAGGAGTLIKDMPKARVVVHQRGARHLVDPSRLVASVMEASGQAMMAKYGEMVPVGEGRIMAVGEGDVIELGRGQTLKFFDAPGHAPHELCIYESRNRGIFTGDAVGVYVPGQEFLFPAAQPPNFNLELCIGTIRRLMALNASRIYFAHFGVTEKVHKMLQMAIDKLLVWDRIVTEAVKQGNLDSAAAKLTEHARADVEAVRKNRVIHEYLTSYSVPTSVSGFMKYQREKLATG